MAATSTDDQVPTHGDETCASKQDDSESRCPGRKADGFEHCLAHLEPVQLDQFLEGLSPGSDLDASGTTISADLLAQILQALRRGGSRPEFGRVSFDGVAFKDGAEFIGAMFNGYADFTRVQFVGDAKFTHAEFTGAANFEYARFGGAADFEGARFDEAANFDDARFEGEASFSDAAFGRGAQFELTVFTGDAWFGAASFMGDAEFTGAQFSGIASFKLARFRETVRLWPLMARQLTLDEAVFDRPVTIEVAAATVSCIRTTWNAGVSLQLRYATVKLTDVTFTRPSFVSGSDQPFLRPVRLEPPHYTGPLQGLGLLKPNPEDVLKERELFQKPDSAPDEAWMPMIVSLRGADAANLSLSDINLSDCYFAGTLLLDQLRLEGRCVFDHPPTGIYSGKAWPPVWWWSRRQILTEEGDWRAATRKYAGWTWDSTRLTDAEVRPERLAALYRQLRKAQEDAKNEPGAADFYYGEMEMRRHARSTPGAERLILALYWAVSGYGLRATRAFLTLAILILGSAAVLQRAGFPGHPPAYVDSLLYAAGSVLSLSLVIGHLPVVLTHWGDVIRMLLRIAGPVLLGLAALALRGRVKR